MAPENSRKTPWQWLVDYLTCSPVLDLIQFLVDTPEYQPLFWRLTTVKEISAATLEQLGLHEYLARPEFFRFLEAVADVLKKPLVLPPQEAVIEPRTESRPRIVKLWQVPSKNHHDRTVTEYLYLVKYVANKMLLSMPPSVEIDDLVSSGVVGLLDAVEKYDPERDTEFETYAVSRIRGAIVDDLRGLDWVPRSLRRKARRLEESEDALTSKLHREPSEAEQADFLEIGVEELREIKKEVQDAMVMSLNDPVGPEVSKMKNLDPHESGTFLDLLSHPQSTKVLTDLQTQDTQELIVKTLLAMPSKERTVITLYHYEEFTLKEIGRTLGVCESRVSQIYTKAKRRLSQRLGRIKQDLWF